MRYPQVFGVFEAFQKESLAFLGQSRIVQAKGFAQMETEVQDEQNGISCEVCLSLS